MNHLISAMIYGIIYRTKQKAREILYNQRGEFGISSLIGVAIGLIIAAFVLIPGIRNFATHIMKDMEQWWTDSVSNQVFPN